MIALSQLNRAVENREDRRPRMADLRESGAIEQDADLVLLLHRPEYYDPNDQPGVAELIIAKNRNGATGQVKLTFLKNITRFENLANVTDPIDTRGVLTARVRGDPPGRDVVRGPPVEGEVGEDRADQAGELEAVSAARAGDDHVVAAR